MPGPGFFVLANKLGYDVRDRLEFWTSMTGINPIPTPRCATFVPLERQNTGYSGQT